MAIRVEIQPDRIQVEGSDFAELVLAYGPRLSNDGVLVETDEELPVGRSVQFVLRLADGPVLARAVGVVGGRHRGSGGGSGGVMVGFVNIEEGHALIQRIMDHHQLESGRPPSGPAPEHPDGHLEAGGRETPGAEDGFRENLASLPAASSQPDGVTMISDEVRPGFAPGMGADRTPPMARGDMPGREILDSIEPSLAGSSGVDISSLLGEVAGPPDALTEAIGGTEPASELQPSIEDALDPPPLASPQDLAAEQLEPGLGADEPLLTGTEDDGPEAEIAPEPDRGAGVAADQENGATGWGSVLADTEESSPWEVKPPSDFTLDSPDEAGDRSATALPSDFEPPPLGGPIVPEPLGASDAEEPALPSEPVAGAAGSFVDEPPRPDPMADATWLLDSWKREESDSVVAASETLRARPRRRALQGLSSWLWPLLAIGVVVLYLGVQRLYEPPPVIGALPTWPADGAAAAADSEPAPVVPISLADLRAGGGPISVDVQPGALSGSPVTIIERVTWIRRGRQTRVLIWGDGAFDPGVISWSRDPAANRDTIRIRDILSAHQPDRYGVATPEVVQVLMGYHQEGVDREASITVVTSGPGVRLTEVSIERRRMALIVSSP